jgi:hypothetical protein
MPRKPTLLALKARASLVDLLGNLPKGTSLPPLGVLGNEFRLHSSTIFRLLHDLATEGLVWQSPGGKFFPVSAQRNTLRGAPVCFIGRELWQWSRLYQEILDGISEVCSANGSPLILLSSRSLVRQEAAAVAPTFATLRAQQAELANLSEALPKGSAGILFDHLWKEGALGKIKWPGGDRIQLLFGGGFNARVLAPDHAAGAQISAVFARERGFKKIGLILPFAGDPAINAALDALRCAFAPLSPTEIPHPDTTAALKHFRKVAARMDLLVCPEDNVTLAISKILADLPQKLKPLLLGTQGTGVLQAPHIRLRIDYRRLGRAAASSILHGTKPPPITPKLIHQPVD